MKKKIQDVFHDVLIVRLLIASVLLCIAAAALAVWKWSLLPPQVPLYYSLPRGDEQLGTPMTLLLLPMLSFALVCLHLFIAILLYNRLQLAARLLMITAALMVVLLLIAFANILFLIT